MTDERADLMLDILKRIQLDVASIKREQESHSVRLLALEAHLGAVMTSLHGIHADLSSLNLRVDRIEQRLELVVA